MKREEIKFTKSYKFWFECLDSKFYNVKSRITLVFNIVLQRRVGFSGKGDSAVHSKWKDNQLHLSTRVLSNNIQTTLASVCENIEDTVSHFERVVTTELSYRKCEEQDGLNAILYEIINESRGAVAQSMCFRLFGVRKAGEIEWKEFDRDLSGNNVKEDYIHGRCSTPVGGDLFATREKSGEFNSITNKRKNDEDGSDLHLWSDRSGKVEVIEISSEED